MERSETNGLHKMRWSRKYIVTPQQGNGCVPKAQWSLKRREMHNNDNLDTKISEISQSAASFALQPVALTDEQRLVNNLTMPSLAPSEPAESSRAHLSLRLRCQNSLVVSKAVLHSSLAHQSQYAHFKHQSNATADHKSRCSPGPPPRVSP